MGARYCLRLEKSGRPWRDAPTTIGPDQGQRQPDWVKGGEGRAALTRDYLKGSVMAAKSTKFPKQVVEAIRAARFSGYAPAPNRTGSSASGPWWLRAACLCVRTA